MTKLFSLNLPVLALLLLSSCNLRSTSQLDDNTSSKPSIPTPVVYDVICFDESTMISSGINCSPTGTFRVQRGTEVETYINSSTSVQSGQKMIPSFRTKVNDAEKISLEDMESLSKGGAVVYAIDSVLNYRSNNLAVRVLIFDKNSGKFQTFGAGEFQKHGEETSKFIFTSGDMEVKKTTTEMPPTSKVILPL